MNLFAFFNTIDRKLDRFISNKYQDTSKNHLRKYFIYGNALYLVMLFALLIVSLLLDAPVFVQYCLVGILLGVFMVVPFLTSEKVEHIIVFQKFGMLALILIFIPRLGGLFTSGGMIFIGLAPSLYMLIFKKYKWMISVYAFYVISIIVLFALDSSLSGKDILTQQQNNTLFTLILLGITSYIFTFAMYAQKIYTNLERRETQRQKEINDAKTRLYTNITHEFRTPITVILGMAEALKASNTITTIEKSDTIIRNGKNLLQLVDQLLDMSKIESGNLRVNKIHGNIVPFLRYVFQLQEYYAQEKDLQFIFETESQSYEVDFDPEKIVTIVSNLLNNAIKFTPSGGIIAMKVGIAGRELKIDVVDNGMGIPHDKHSKIFDRFYQVDGGDTRQAGGAGIGLALTRELINLMGGSISLVSEPGKNTVFSVYLPITNVAKKTISYEELTGLDNGNGLLDESINEIEIPQNNANRKKTLLIVEDNKDVVQYLQLCYRDLFLIDIAYDGEEGYQKALFNIPDVIISDIMMPKMDGFALCKKLKDDYRTSHIPIILLTAKADIPSRIQGLEQGADAYIVKPFNQHELLVRIRKLLELRRKLFLRYSNNNLSDLPDHPILKREDNFFKKVTDHINENLHDENYSVTSLCKGMVMSKSQLYRKVNALANISVAKYIRKLRMERARHLLMTTSMNVTEVSLEVGIKTLSTFSEIFKEEFGYNPSKYVISNGSKAKVLS